MNITEDWILSQSPNSNTFKRGKVLSEHNSFLNLSKNKYENMYWAECSSSVNRNYSMYIYFNNNNSFICRCSCPSRQIPCKHLVGLMFEILYKKSFGIYDISPYDEEINKILINNQKESDSKKVNNSAKMKKIKKQLDGLDMLENILSDLLSQGVMTLSSTSFSTYDKLAKSLGSEYYLTGAQNSIFMLSNEIKNIQNDKSNKINNYNEIVRILIWLNSLIHKSRNFLNKKLMDKNFDNEYDVLFESLGGIWRLDDLKKLNAFKENVRIVQLSFDVISNVAKKELVDCGYWIELETGEIHKTLNYRPIKALKHIKPDDSFFEVLNVDKLYYYPSTSNKRIRWENFTQECLDSNVICEIIKNANKDLSVVIKSVKNKIKNTLSDKYVGVLVKYKYIGKIENEFVLEDEIGNRIVLRNYINDDEFYNPILNLETVLNFKNIREQVLFGIMFYDCNDYRLCLQPESIVTDNCIIRLKY